MNPGKVEKIAPVTWFHETSQAPDEYSRKELAKFAAQYVISPYQSNDDAAIKDHIRRCYAWADEFMSYPDGGDS